MNSTLALAVLAGVCLILPTRLLVLLSVLGVMLADSQVLERHALYFARFVPSAVLAARTLVVLARQRFQLVAYNRLLKAWTPFLVFSAISILYSIDRSLTGQRLLSGVFVIVGFGLGIPLFFNRAEDIRRLATSVAVVLVVGVLYSLYVTPENPAETMVKGRVSGAFDNPNTLGLLAMEASIVLLYWWQTEKRRLHRSVIALALFGCVAAVMVSGSRASALGLACGLLVLVRARGRIERRALRNLFWIASTVVAAYMLSDFFFPDFLSGLLRSDTSSRTFLWKRAWLLAQNHPVIGVGFAASDELFERDHLFLETLGIYISGPHSSLMRLLVDLGFVGVTLALGAFIAVFKQVWRYLRSMEDSALAAALLGTVVAGLVNSMFESWLFGFGSSATVPFWFFLALLSCQADRARLRVSAAAYRRRQDESLRLRAQSRRSPAAAGEPLAPGLPDGEGAPG